ncbi:MAG: AMP-binding protein [Solirubrobacterales bacterium]|nr:AMP-binding protein [Solirubrobacterales bacterium]
MILDGALEAFGADPSRLAVADDSGAWTWTGLMAEVGQTASELGPSPVGEPVEIRVPSSREFLTRFLAAARLRRPACTLHTDWSGPELEAATSATRSFRPAVPPAEDNDPFFYIGFTSGTSGRPKPFARRSMSWISSFEPAGKMFSIEAGDVVYLPGSLQHSHFLFGAVLGLNLGATVRMFERFDAAKLAEELREVSRGIVYLVPTMLFTLDELGLEPLTGVHSLVISGSKMEPHHWDIAHRLFPGATASEIYGASELSFVTVNSGEAEQPDPGFVGPPFSGVEIEIRSNGDGPGLVFVRSPYLFDGYFDESGSRSPIGPDGFMTVGDVGVLSEEGLSIVGRASNMLITGGKNVHPEEVESRLAEHESVSECVVVGLPDDRWGEEIVAFLVASNPGDLPDAGELRDHLKDLVASYKVPKRWFTVEQIPRTRAGKTDRSRDRLLELATEI